MIKELNRIREQYLAWDNGEHEEDIYCIAVPIFDFSNMVIASISISVTVKYTPIEKLASYERLLKEAALNISKNLGYVHNRDSQAENQLKG